MANKRAEKDVFAELPLAVRDRFSWVKLAGDQVSDIANLMRSPIREMLTAETREQEVALSLCLDRLKHLAGAITTLGDETEEYHPGMEEALWLSASTDHR